MTLPQEMQLDNFKLIRYIAYEKKKNAKFRVGRGGFT